MSVHVRLDTTHAHKHGSRQPHDRSLRRGDHGYGPGKTSDVDLKPAPGYADKQSERSVRGPQRYRRGEELETPA